MCYCS